MTNLGLDAPKFEQDEFLDPENYNGWISEESEISQPWDGQVGPEDTSAAPNTNDDQNLIIPPEAGRQEEGMQTHDEPNSPTLETYTAAQKFPFKIAKQASTMNPDIISKSCTYTNSVTMLVY